MDHCAASFLLPPLIAQCGAFGHDAAMNTHSVVRLAQYTTTDLDGIAGDETDPFGDATGLTWLPKDEHFGVRSGDRLVAHAGLVVAPVSVGDTRTKVVGLGGVIVSADQRGRGLARLVVTAAMEYARGMGPDLGLLFCWPDRAPLYQRLGWQMLEGDVRADQPDGPVVMPMRGMWTPLREGAEWPSGPVHVLSLPM
jgi:predicted N-acetyltransferase YhbS